MWYIYLNFILGGFFIGNYLGQGHGVKWYQALILIPLFGSIAFLISLFPRASFFSELLFTDIYILSKRELRILNSNNNYARRSSLFRSFKDKLSKTYIVDLDDQLTLINWINGYVPLPDDHWTTVVQNEIKEEKKLNQKQQQ